MVGRLVNMPRRALILATVSAADGGSHAVGELDAPRLCRSYGRPIPSRQAIRRGPDGKRRWPDLFFDDYSLVVEIDGLWQMDVGGWSADLQRLNDHAAAGEALLRFPAFAVREQQKEVATAIARAASARLAGFVSSVGVLTPTNDTSSEPRSEQLESGAQGFDRHPQLLEQGEVGRRWAAQRG